MIAKCQPGVKTDRGPARPLRLSFSLYLETILTVTYNVRYNVHYLCEVLYEKS